MEKGAQNKITQGVIWRQLLLFFFPILFGSIFQQLYAMTDAVIVGQFGGKEALAAIDSTVALIRLFINFFVGLSTGATILISQAFGAHNDDAVSRGTHTALVFAVLGGAAIMLLGLLLAPAGVALMQVPGELAPDATRYMRIYFCGMVPSMVYNIGAAILRAVGDSKRPFYILIVSTVINIALDLLFVAVFGWGMAGAGIATVISQLASMLLVLRVLRRVEGPHRLEPRALRLDGPVTMDILRKGLPIGIQSAMYPISNMVISARINTLGTDTIAAWAVCGKMDFIIWVVMDALSVATATFVAQNYGAGAYARVKRSVRTCIVMSLCIILPLSALLYLFGRPLSTLFVRDGAVIALSTDLIRFYSLFFFTFIFGEMLGSAIRGTGQTLVPMIITLTCTCLLRVVWILLLIPADASVYMIVAAYPVTWIATSVAFIAYYAWYRHKIEPRPGTQITA